MTRRFFLKAVSGSLAAAWSVLLAIPGARYVMATIRQQETSDSQVKRVARLADLPVGRPVSVAVTGNRRDAWTTYPNEPLGQVWLVRRDDASVRPEECKVDAYSSVCPHLRCRVHVDPAKDEFICPCHRGAFDIQGKPLTAKQLGHHNPAPRPLESYAVTIVPDENNEWWVEVAYEA